MQQAEAKVEEKRLKGIKEGTRREREEQKLGGIGLPPALDRHPPSTEDSSWKNKLNWNKREKIERKKRLEKRAKRVLDRKGY